MCGAAELGAIGRTLGMFQPNQDNPGDGRRHRRRGLTGTEQDGRANRQPRKRSEPDRPAFSESSHCLFRVGVSSKFPSWRTFLRDPGPAETNQNAIDHASIQPSPNDVFVNQTAGAPVKPASMLEMILRQDFFAQKGKIKFRFFLVRSGRDF